MTSTNGVVNKEKSSGAKTEPCGTPVSQLRMVEAALPTLTVVDAVAALDPKEDISSAVKDMQRRLEEIGVHASYPSNVKERESLRSASQSPAARKGTIHGTLSVIVNFTRRFGR